MDLGQRIRERRKAIGLTQLKMASAIGVSVQSISAIEAGRRVPSLQVLVALAQELDISVDYLLTGRETARVDLIGAIKENENLDQEIKNALVVIIRALCK